MHYNCLGKLIATFRPYVPKDMADTRHQGVVVKRLDTPLGKKQLFARRAVPILTDSISADGNSDSTCVPRHDDEPHPRQHWR